MPTYWQIRCRFRIGIDRFRYWVGIFGRERGFRFWRSEYLMRIRTPFKQFRRKGGEK